MFKKKEKIFLLTVFCFILLVGVVSADLYSEDNVYGQSITNITRIIQYVNDTNQSDYWDNLDTPVDLYGTLDIRYYLVSNPSGFYNFTNFDPTTFLINGSSIYLGNYILDVFDGNFRIRNETTNIMYFNATGNEMVFTTNTRTMGFAEGASPLKLREGVQFFNVAGVKSFSIYHAHGNEEWRNVSDIFNSSVVFELDEKDNPYGMDWIIWDKLTQRPPLVINFGAEGRATTFDRSLRIGKANSPVDENFTLCTNLACNSSDVADLEVEGSIWAGRNFIGSGLMTPNMSGAYGIGVGTLSLIGGSKTTLYGGIDGGGGKVFLQGGRGRDAGNNPSSYAPILLQSNGGNVGIGTTSPDRVFEIFGATSVFRFRDSGATASATNAFIEFGGTDGGEWNRTGYIGDGSSGNTDLYFQAEEGSLRLGDSSSHSVLILSGGNATFSGVVYGDNLFIPQYLFTHTNATIPVLGVGTWTNITFAQEDADIKFGISHTYNDNTNQTFMIPESGIYEVDYDLDVEDNSGTSSDVDIAARLVYLNGTEVIGSVFETDITKKGVSAELSHDFLVTVQAGESFIAQFTASDVDVRISTHGTFGDHPESATITIKKIANL